MAKIEMSINELEDLLKEQKRVTAEYMTRNLSVYNFWEGNPFDIATAKDQMKTEANKSGYPSEFEVLKKYIKP